MRREHLACAALRSQLTAKARHGPVTRRQREGVLREHVSNCTTRKMSRVSGLNDTHEARGHIRPVDDDEEEEVGGR